jgi:hypothetical protein
MSGGSLPSKQATAGEEKPWGLITSDDADGTSDRSR